MWCPLHNLLYCPVTINLLCPIVKSKPLFTLESTWLNLYYPLEKSARISRRNYTDLTAGAYAIQLSPLPLALAREVCNLAPKPNPHTKQVTICQTTRWRSNIDTYYQPLNITVYPCYYTVLVNHQWALLTFFILFHADFFATCVRRFWWRFRMLGEHEGKKKILKWDTIAFSNSVWTHHINNFP